VHDQAVMITPTRGPNPQALGARWTRATDLLAREAQRLGASPLNRFQRRRAVRRIQVLERIARRAMNDYRVALERELDTSLPPRRMDEPGEHRIH
jgi:hypothetical protein